MKGGGRHARRRGMSRGDRHEIDEVVAASRLAVPQVLATLSALEMRRLVRRLEGNRVMRK